jgi:hypothetical protein
MSNQRILKVATLPAGRYVVGDPCYAIPDNKWMEWLEAADYMIQDREHVLLADVFGYPCVGVSTMYGDGMYVDDNGHNFPVDAGLIGLVPTAVAPVSVLKDPETVIVELKTPAECRYEDGVIVLGDIRIDTGDQSDDEDEEYDDDDEFL